MLSPGSGNGAKAKGALYRETLRTTGFYMGRIVIVTREFTPIPSPPLRCPRFRESSRLPECVWEGMRNLSVRWDGQTIPKQIRPLPPPVADPEVLGHDEKFYEILSPTPFVRPIWFKKARALVMRFLRHAGIYPTHLSSHLITLLPVSPSTLRSVP